MFSAMHFSIISVVLYTEINNYAPKRKEWDQFIVINSLNCFNNSTFNTWNIKM